MSQRSSVTLSSTLSTLKSSGSVSMSLAKSEKPRLISFLMFSCGLTVIKELKRFSILGPDNIVLSFDFGLLTWIWLSFKFIMRSLPRLATETRIGVCRKPLRDTLRPKGLHALSALVTLSRPALSSSCLQIFPAALPRALARSSSIEGMLPISL